MGTLVLKPYDYYLIAYLAVRCPSLVRADDFEMPPDTACLLAMAHGAHEAQEGDPPADADEISEYVTRQAAKATGPVA